MAALLGVLRLPPGPLGERLQRSEGMGKAAGCSRNSGSRSSSQAPCLAALHPAPGTRSWHSSIMVETTWAGAGPSVCSNVRNAIRQQERMHQYTVWAGPDQRRRPPSRSASRSMRTPPPRSPESGGGTLYAQTCSCPSKRSHPPPEAMAPGLVPLHGRRFVEHASEKTGTPTPDLVRLSRGNKVWRSRVKR